MSEGPIPVPLIPPVMEPLPGVANAHNMALPSLAPNEFSMQLPLGLPPIPAIDTGMEVHQPLGTMFGQDMQLPLDAGALSGASTPGFQVSLMPDGMTLEITDDNNVAYRISMQPGAAAVANAALKLSAAMAGPPVGNPIPMLPPQAAPATTFSSMSDALLQGASLSDLLQLAGSVGTAGRSPAAAPSITAPPASQGQNNITYPGLSSSLLAYAAALASAGGIPGGMQAGMPSQLHPAAGIAGAGVALPAAAAKATTKTTKKKKAEGTSAAGTSGTGTGTKNGDGKYRGVHWHATNKKWEVRAWLGGKNAALGYYCSEEEAARAYDRAIHYLHGRDAKLNFKDEVPEEPDAELLARLSGTHRRAGSKSSYMGVKWRNCRNKWLAMIRAPDGKRLNLGSYSSDADAARAYDVASYYLYGWSAKLNFKDEIPPPPDAEMAARLAGKMAG